MSPVQAGGAHRDGTPIPEASSAEADVIVIGAGILGLLNALQLAKRGLRVAIVDTTSQPRSYKVGESLLVYSNAFLRTIGELDEFLVSSFPKQGVWFCHGGEHEEGFENTTEWAFESKVPARWEQAMADKELFRTMFGDVQIVRPEAEDVMREAALRHPRVAFFDGLVREVRLGEGEAGHEVEWRAKRGEEGGLIRGRWLMDNSGRRRLLAKLLGHDVGLDDGFQTTAVWAQFRDAGEERFDWHWSYAFPDGASARRDYNTCHLWGLGYWIWVIRLTGGRISVGASFDQSRAPEGADRRAQFWELINRYPLLREMLSEETMLEFRQYANVQYIADTHVSSRRYAIAGDAASIIDAYYSQGMSLAMVTSWHVANIIARDIHDDEMDESYIERVNHATLQDWHLMRSLIRAKYSPAIQDPRYFVLSHALDYTVLAAALSGRFRLSRWLAETGGLPERESTPHRKLRAYLERRMFLSQSFPWSRSDPETVRRCVERLQRGLERRALWRLSNDVHLRRIKCIVRASAPIPPFWRLPLLRGSRPADISPREIKEPAAVRVRGTEVQPIGMLLAAPTLAAVFAGAYCFDALDTCARKMLRRWRLRRSQQD